jgi:hypothetical protein
MKSVESEFGTAWRRYRYYYLILAPLALADAMLLGPRSNHALLVIVGIEYVLIAYALAVSMSLFVKRLRNGSWDESLKYGFWTGILWIVLLTVLRR